MYILIVPFQTSKIATMRELVVSLFRTSKICVQLCTHFLIAFAGEIHTIALNKHVTSPPVVKMCKPILQVATCGMSWLKLHEFIPG